MPCASDTSARSAASALHADVRRALANRLAADESKGVTGECVIQCPGAAHNEEAWAQRFPRALQFLYSRPIDQ